MHVCKFTTLQVCKLASLQVCKIKIKIKIKITNIQFDKLQVHVCKYEKLQNYQITKLQNIKLQSYKLQNCKFINCMCMFINFKFIKIKSSQFQIIIITKIVNTCLQICKITKLPKLQILQVHFCIFTSKCTCSICMFSDLNVLQNCKIMNI